MGPGLTEDDMGRIAEYLRTPFYDREPDQLVPGGDQKRTEE